MPSNRPPLNIWFRCLERLVPTWGSEDLNRRGIFRRVAENKFEVVLFANASDPECVFCGNGDEITDGRFYGSTMLARACGARGVFICPSRRGGSLIRASKKDTTRALRITTTATNRANGAANILAEAERLSGTGNHVRAKTYRGNVLRVTDQRDENGARVIGIIRGLGSTNERADLYTPAAAAKKLATWGATLDSPTCPPAAGSRDTLTEIESRPVHVPNPNEVPADSICDG